MRMIGQIALGVFAGMSMFAIAAALVFNVVATNDHINTLADQTEVTR